MAALDLEHQQLLVQTAVVVVHNPNDLQRILGQIDPLAYGRLVPIGATPRNAIDAVVRASIGESWVRQLVVELEREAPTRSEFKALLAVLDRPDSPTTASNPFEEVLLPGGKPFANRKELRGIFQDMASANGPRVLLVDGDRDTGKSFSIYLLSHAATTKGFAAHKVDVGQQTPNSLAETILGRVGDASPDLPLQGTESAERWAQRLAEVVLQRIRARAKMRFLFFDGFPKPDQPPLPPETSSFILQLAVLAEEEFHDCVRIVLIKFPGDLPGDIEDFARRELAQGFSSTDMIAVVMQVARSRGWEIGEAVVKQKIDEVMTARPSGKIPSLRARFVFLKDLIETIARAATK